MIMLWLGGYTYVLWEAGGGKYIRKFWSSIVETIRFKAVIFVVNTHELHRVKEAREALSWLIYNQDLDPVFLLVIYNTQAHYVPQLNQEIQTQNSSVATKGKLGGKVSNDKESKNSFL